VADGGANELLKTDGSGQLGWTADLTYDSTGGLKVTTASGPHLRINPDANDASSNARTYLGQATAANQFLSGSADDDTVLRGPSNLLFGTGNSGAPTEKMRIAGDGKVGIGESSPDHMFHIKGSTPILAVESSSWVSGVSAALRLSYTDGNAREIRGHYDHGIQFFCNAGETLRIKTNGDVAATAGNILIDDGNLVVASGHGIDFSATSGTGDSEILKDYEEGTYQPTITGSSSGSWNTTGYTYLSYTKIGRIVHIGGYLNINSESSPSGDVYISLPFAVADLNQNAEYANISVSMRSHGGSNLYNLTGAIATTNAFQLLAVDGSGSGTWLDHNDIGSAWNLRIGGCYASSA
jgi:hypothetical protein